MGDECNLNQDKLDEIKNDTITRFKLYFNLDNLHINVKQNETNSTIFEIKIEIELDKNKFKKELEELKQTDTTYETANIDTIIEKIDFLTPKLTGNINLASEESHIHIVKVGLFSSKSGDFKPIEINLIKKALGGRGIGALLVLMFIYMCFSFIQNIRSCKIENVSLDDSSEYPGWYEKLLFKYPDDDEVANLYLTPEIFDLLQNKIFEYSKKNETEIHILQQIILDIHKLLLLANVAEDPEAHRAAQALFDFSNGLRPKKRLKTKGGTRKTKNKKTKNKKTKNKKTRKRYKKKNKKRLTSKKKF